MADSAKTDGTNTPTNNAETKKEIDGVTTGGADASVEVSTNGQKEVGLPPGEEGAVDEYPHGWRLGVILAALCISSFLSALDQTIVATAIPRITDEFKGLDKVSWYSSAYFMTFGGMQPSWGKGFRYFPLKKTFLAAFLIFEMGSLVCGVAKSANTLIAGRALAGWGAAGLATGVLTIVSFSAPQEKRPMLVGVMGSMYGLAAVCGPLVGGAFTEHVTWRWCFYINLPIGAVAAVAMIVFFQPPSAARPPDVPLRERLLQLDPLGVSLCMGFIICYITALGYGGQTKSWGDGVVIGLLVGFGIILVAFVAWEAYLGERAMMPPRLMLQRTILVQSLYAFTLAASYMSALFYLPIYFQSIQGVNALQSGVRNLPTVLTVTVFIIMAGGFITKTGHAVPVQAVGSALCAVGLGLYYTMDTSTSTGRWIGYQIVGSVGWGISYQVPNMIAGSATPPNDLATATAIVLFFQIIGGAFTNSAANSAFVNQMVNKAATTVPGVSAQTLIRTGATELRTVFSADQLPGVLIAYVEGLRVVWAIAAAMAVVSFLSTGLASWKRLHGVTAAVAA